MESVSDPIHSVWDLYRTPYNPHGISIGPHAALMGFHSPRSNYVLFLFLFIVFCTLLCFCVVFYAFPVLFLVPCSLKTSAHETTQKRTKKVHTFSRAMKSHAGCMGSDRDPMRTVWDLLKIHYGVYGIRYRFHTDCMGPDTGPIRIVSGPIQITYGLYAPDTDPLRSVWGPIQIPYGLHGA